MILIIADAGGFSYGKNIFEPLLELSPNYFLSPNSFFDFFGLSHYFLVDIILKNVTGPLHCSGKYNLTKLSHMSAFCLVDSSQYHYPY